MKRSKNGVIKRGEVWKDTAKSSFEPSPEFLNRIEFRGVRRKKNHPAAKILGSRREPCLGMERSIVHHNHGVLVQGRKKLVGKPGLKQRMVHRSAILEGGQNLPTHFCRNNSTALKFAAADAVEHPLVSRRVPILSIEISIYAAFVCIRYFFRRDILDFLLISGYFLRVLFRVAGRLFFRVIPNRSSASRIPLSLQPNSSAISR